MTKASIDDEWTLNTEKACTVVMRVSKVSPLHANKAYRGSAGISPLILNLGTRWNSEDSGNKCSTLRYTEFEFRQETAFDVRINIQRSLIVKL
jgi:hypothetical protein